MEFINPDDKRIARPLINFLVAAIFLVALAWFIVFAFGKNVISSGQSMEPTIAADDTVLVDRIEYDFLLPQRYDVIAFYLDRNENTGEGAIDIKRIIGLPGETVQIKDGVVYVDGEPLISEKLGVVELAGIASEPVALDDDEYFVLGDNIRASEDSRFASIGNVKFENILGKVWTRVFPLSRFRLIK